TQNGTEDAHGAEGSVNAKSAKKEELKPQKENIMEDMTKVNLITAEVPQYENNPATLTASMV
ncbi:hypothetical protein, partial [Acinetobacter baumannii]|uniref:hypothetical protein n=1 Tax=Acinetobacter baumannii TaxID=470 RepID=UPI00148EF59D